MSSIYHDQAGGGGAAGLPPPSSGPAPSPCEWRSSVGDRVTEPHTPHFPIPASQPWDLVSCRGLAGSLWRKDVDRGWILGRLHRPPDVHPRFS